eukprot:gene26964-32468_t
MSSKRRGEIARVLQDEGTISIADLAQRLGVSLETIRRDVKPLTDEGVIVRTHGAVGLPQHLGEAPFERRMRENASAKRAIARHVFMAGGELRSDNGAAFGAFAIDFVSRFNVAHAIISIGAIDATH